jgi:hypothetical protein
MQNEVLAVHGFNVDTIFHLMASRWQRNERQVQWMYCILSLAGPIPQCWTDTGWLDWHEATPGLSPAERSR